MTVLRKWADALAKSIGFSALNRAVASSSALDSWVHASGLYTESLRKEMSSPDLTRSVVGSVRIPPTTAKGNLRWMLTAKVRTSPSRFHTARPRARCTGLISTARVNPWISEISVAAAEASHEIDGTKIIESAEEATAASIGSGHVATRRGASTGWPRSQTCSRAGSRATPTIGSPTVATGLRSTWPTSPAQSSCFTVVQT